MGGIPCSSLILLLISLWELKQVNPMLLLGLLTESLPGPLIGIIGYDLFRRAVVEMKPLNNQNSDKPDESGAGEDSPHPNFSVCLHDPRSYAPAPARKEMDLLLQSLDEEDNSEKLPPIPWKPLIMVRVYQISSHSSISYVG